MGNEEARILEKSPRRHLHRTASQWEAECHLEEIDYSANAMFDLLMKQYAERECVTEELKAQDQMLWVQRVNSIRDRATEIINQELIYT